MKRQRGRNRNKGGGNSNNPNRSFDSNGPEVKVRGNANTVYDKYVQLARDATSSGNRVRAENLLQHAEHYLRVHTEQQAKAQAAREEKEAREAKRREERAARGESDDEDGNRRGRRRNRRDDDRNSDARNQDSRNQDDRNPTRDRQDTAEDSEDGPAEASGLEVVKPKSRRRAPAKADESADATEDASDDAGPRRRRAPSRKRAEDNPSQDEGVEAAE